MHKRVHTVLTGMQLHAMVAAMRAAGGDEFEGEVAAALGALINKSAEDFGEFQPAVRAVAGWTFGGKHYIN